MIRFRPILALLAVLVAGDKADAALSGVVVPTSTSSYTGPCDTVTGCAAAYSMTRAMRAAYTGNLFQLHNGSTTLNVGQTNHVVDTSGIVAFCAGVLNGCRISKIYDHINSADLVPLTGAPVGAAPVACATGVDCGSTFWLDPSTGLPAVVTVFPTEYDVAAASVNAGANPTSVWFYGRNDQYPGQFGIGHAPAVANNNGTNFIASVIFSDFPFDAVFPWVSGYLKCSAATGECIGIDEETSVDPYNAGTAPGGIGATYATATQEDITVLATWDGVTNVKIYTNSATATFAGSPPASVTYDSSALVPGNHVKLGCGGDCVHSQIIFREGIIANATFSGSDYTSLATNTSTFYAAHTTPATCHGGADLGYYTAVKSIGGGDWGVYQPGPSSTLVSYALAQTRASYFGPVADLNNGTTTQTFNSAMSAGSAGCGLDPAAATFCTAGSLGHCIVTKLYNQGTWSSTSVGNVHDTNLDLVFAVGHRPTVTFNSLNGLPTMSFAGSEYGCATVGGTGAGAFLGYSAVARRTSGSSFANALFVDSSAAQVGFNTSGNAGFYGGGATISQAATESHWHAIMYENGTGSPFVDGSAGVGTVSSAHQSIAASSHICIGAKNDGTQPLTGDVAEVDAFVVNSHAAAEYTTQGATMFAAMQSTWGTLPN